MVDALHVVVACPNATKATMMTDVIVIEVALYAAASSAHLG